VDEPLDLPYSMKMVFKRVVTAPLGKDPRTDWQKHVLGISHDVNRRDVLQCGLADFKTGYGKDDILVSCRDKALLYCHYYLKYTFFACKRAFSDPSLAAFCDIDAPICLVDIGCGPGTAAFAVSDSLAAAHLVYAGIDESNAMLDLAPRMLRAGQTERLISPSSVIILGDRWQDLNRVLLPQDAQVLIVFSFCLGSPSLRLDDIEGLAEWIQGVAKVTIRRPVVCFVNSPHSSAMEKFEHLKKCLHRWKPLSPFTSTNVRYYNYQRSVGGQPIVYELGSAG
jgi:hypothetical protein